MKKIPFFGKQLVQVGKLRKLPGQRFRFFADIYLFVLGEGVLNLAVEVGVYLFPDDAADERRQRQFTFNLL